MRTRILTWLRTALAAGAAFLLSYGLHGLYALESSSGDPAAQQIQSSLVEVYNVTAVAGIAMLLGSLQVTHRLRNTFRAPDNGNF